MTPDEWIAALHAKVVPPNGRSTPERAILFLRPRLDDLPAEWFTEEALSAVFVRLRSLASAERVRKALRDFHAARDTPTRTAPRFVPEPEPSWSERVAFMRSDWDDANGILAKVNRYRSDHWALRKLALLVAQWAPQHLGLLPPDILATVSANSEPFATLLKRIDTSEFVPPTRTRNEYLDDLAVPAEPRPRYLTPEQLDALNPLPDGRRRVA
ncbi:MAG TPA: hypothetical protein VEU08_18840 [Vicinamibacterales bacterium]|nr:hypothetical protein [Vicinamibacterales bacterium]